MVFIALVERVRITVLFNSGTKILFFCILAYFLTFPVGLNCVGSSAVAITAGDEGTFLVIGQIFAIDFN